MGDIWEIYGRYSGDLGRLGVGELGNVHEGARLCGEGAAERRAGVAPFRGVGGEGAQVQPRRAAECLEPVRFRLGVEIRVRVTVSIPLSLTPTLNPTLALTLTLTLTPTLALPLALPLSLPLALTRAAARGRQGGRRGRRR